MAFEAGPDNLLAQKPEALTLCRELGLADQLIPTNPKQRAVYVLHRRRLTLPGDECGVPTTWAPSSGAALPARQAAHGTGSGAARPPPERRRPYQLSRRRFGQECVERLGSRCYRDHAGDPSGFHLSTFPASPSWRSATAT